jgi:hypothetical protein
MKVFTEEYHPRENKIFRFFTVDITIMEIFESLF